MAGRHHLQLSACAGTNFKELVIPFKHNKGPSVEEERGKVMQSATPGHKQLEAELQPRILVSGEAAGSTREGLSLRVHHTGLRGGEGRTSLTGSLWGWRTGACSAVPNAGQGLPPHEFISFPPSALSVPVPT